MNSDPDQYVFRTLLSVFHEQIEVSIVIEDTGINQFIFEFLA